MPNQQVDVTVDQHGMPQAPIDPSVTIPASVRAASKAADAIHAQAYASQDPAPAPAPNEPTPAPAPAPNDPTPAPAPVTATVRPDPNAPKGSPEFEAHTEASMKGRWEASQRQLGIAQQQLQELGRELVQTQSLLQRTATAAAPFTPASTTQKRVTDKDVETYGSELIDLATRAAEDAVAPKLIQLEQENQQLRQGLQQTRQQTAKQTVHAALAAWRPDWEMINNDPRFHSWLRLPDLYSGRGRQGLLKEAFDAGNASRVLAFFQGFIQDGLATGSIEPPQQQPGAGDPPPPQRTAAVPLDTLAAPGKAKPATGNSSTSPADKPVITHKYIKDFYNLSRRGAFVGREAEKERLENEIFAAQREGRVR